MNKLKKIYKNNKSLLGFVGLSYFDKLVIFILPLAVLSLFEDKTVYIRIEYIYSIVVVFIPFLDFGLGGYFFYAIRNEGNAKKVVVDILKIFHLLYLFVFLVGLCLIAINYIIHPFEEYIIYIVFRALFILTCTFLTSYYRLVNKPQKALYITISANAISLFFIFFYFFSELEFNLWLVFIGQILFCLVYFFKTLKRVAFNWLKSYKTLEIVSIIRKSVLFSWPTIIQVFILMYVGNYGKINAFEKLSVDEGVLLSLAQRFSMLIHLTHGAILGFMMKDLFVSGDLFTIQKGVFMKYLGLLFPSVCSVVLIIIGYVLFFKNNYELIFLIQITSLIIGYTFFWCVFSYFEIYYSRENKNIIKLYLGLVNGASFVLIFNLLNLGYLERITLSMFASSLLTLIISLITLKKRGYVLS
jgi:O-antigen/teichoic acid export membrane protein